MKILIFFLFYFYNNKNINIDLNIDFNKNEKSYINNLFNILKIDSIINSNLNNNIEILLNKKVDNFLEQEEYLRKLTEEAKWKNNEFPGLDYEKLTTHKQNKKKWTVLIYIAGDNNLYKFALRNISQLKDVGSTDLLNIVVHFDYHVAGKTKETKRFFIKRDGLIQVGNYSAMDSGSEKTLINACDWAISNYPSEYFVLILWNHGTGDLSPLRTKSLINPGELFYYNSISKKIELDRSINFFDFLAEKEFNKGICFDESTQNFLDDEKLTIALKKINELRGGKRIDILMMDACLMACMGIAYSCLNYVNFLVFSQEVVLGPGYNYKKTIRPLTKRIMTPEKFAKYVVKNYETTYSTITQDYTQSCIDLTAIRQLYIAIDELLKIILDFLKYDKKNIIKKTILTCANKNIVTHFSEPSYVDLKHFLENLLLHSTKIKIKNANNQDFYVEISSIIKNIIEKIFPKVIIENCSGNNLNNANGLSAYIPQDQIHPSFFLTEYSKNSLWTLFLNKILEK